GRAAAGEVQPDGQRRVAAGVAPADAVPQGAAGSGPGVAGGDGRGADTRAAGERADAVGAGCEVRRLGAGGVVRGSLPQRQLEVQRVRVRVVVVAVDGAETEALVDVAGGEHVVAGIEAHGGVVEFAGAGDDALGESAAEAEATVRGADEQAFHFAGAAAGGGVDFAEGGGPG